MTRPTVRRAGALDAAALAQVGAATFLETYPHLIPRDDLVSHCRDRHSVAAYAALLADPAATCWLVEHPGTAAPLGYAALCAPDLPVQTDPGDMELRRIYVLSRFQGAGLGRDLVQAVLDTARTAGAPRVLLGVYHGNAPALSFYRRVGFTPVGERAFQVGARTYQDVVMARAP